MIPGFVDETGVLRFRFSPKSAKTWRYTIHSDVTTLDGRTGGLTSYPASAHARQRGWARTPNWWTDDPASELAEGSQQGARTVNRWRVECLRDFAARMLRCEKPKPGD